MTQSWRVILQGNPSSVTSFSVDGKMLPDIKLKSLMIEMPFVAEPTQDILRGDLQERSRVMFIRLTLELPTLPLLTVNCQGDKIAIIKFIEEESIIECYEVDCQINNPSILIFERSVEGLVAYASISFFAINFSIAQLTKNDIDKSYLYQWDSVPSEELALSLLHQGE